MAAANNGIVYFTGQFGGTATMATKAIASKGHYDSYLLSYSSAGKPRWIRTFGDSDYDSGWDLATDTTGNVYISGRYKGTINLGGGSLPASTKDAMFIASFKSTGTPRWSHGYGGGGAMVWSLGLASDGSNVFVTGSHLGAFKVEKTTMPALNNSWQIFAASFTGSGGLRWARSAGQNGSDMAQGVAVGPKGNVFITGRFYGGISFGGPNKGCAGASDLYVASLTNLGVTRWVYAAGGKNQEMGYGIGVDGQGLITVTGEYHGPSNLGGLTLPGAAAGDLFLLQIK